jgi:hypothetical protein
MSDLERPAGEFQLPDNPIDREAVLLEIVARVIERYPGVVKMNLGSNHVEKRPEDGGEEENV